MSSYQQGLTPYSLLERQSKQLSIKAFKFHICYFCYPQNRQKSLKYLFIYKPYPQYSNYFFQVNSQSNSSSAFYYIYFLYKKQISKVKQITLSKPLNFSNIDMTFHFKIQKFIPFLRKVFLQQQQKKQYIIALEVDASQRIRYLISGGQIVSNQRFSLVNNENDVYCTSGFKQCIEVVLYEREKRDINKQPIHMEKQKMIRSATILSETLLKLYNQNQCKNMKQCIVNVQMKTRQRQHYLIKRDLPTDKLDCKVDITFKYDKFRICQGNMPLSKVIHRINLSWKKQQNQQKQQKVSYATSFHEQTFNSTKQSFVAGVNNNLKLSQKVKVPNKKQDQPTKENEEQFSKQTQFYKGRCGTTNLFSCCDNLFSGIQDSQIKFQIVQDVYR